MHVCGDSNNGALNSRGILEENAVFSQKDEYKYLYRSFLSHLVSPMKTPSLPVIRSTYLVSVAAWRKEAGRPHHLCADSIKPIIFILVADSSLSLSLVCL